MLSVLYLILILHVSLEGQFDVFNPGPFILLVLQTHDVVKHERVKFPWTISSNSMGLILKRHEEGE